jgi:phage tail-like protein
VSNPNARYYSGFPVWKSSISPTIMPEFPVNPTRHDPYKNFKFRVKWDGNYIPGVSHISGLVRTTEVVEHREGGDPSTSRKSPGRTQFEAVILERGLTQDTSFEDWANLVWTLGAGLGSEVSLKEFRKDVMIDFYNEAGQLVLAYKLLRCWVSEYQALPNLAANGRAGAIEHIKLENEGWERDGTPRALESFTPRAQSPASCHRVAARPR